MTDLSPETGVRTLLPTWLVAVVILFHGACTSSTEPPATLEYPNVLIITMDTTRADRLGCYGYARDTTPNLDKFAEGAVVFDNAISAAAVTPVSHASIFTGRYPYRHHLRVLHGSSQNRLPDSQLTLAEVLKDVGFQTGAFLSAFPCGTQFGLNQGFDTFNEDYIRAPLDEIISSGGTVNTGANQRAAGPTTDLALKWLARTQSPFFLWVHYFDPHDPEVLPPPKFQRKFPRPTGAMRDALRSIYDMEISYMDQEIGRLFKTLASDGKLDQTIVVIVADHGEGLGDHDWWTHGILYREQIHVPLIVRVPGQTQGRRVKFLVRTVDLVPTVLELAGVNPVPDLDGRSLVPLLKGNAPDPKYTAYADSISQLSYGFAGGIRDEKDEILFTVTDGEWKYIHHLLREPESELYHVAEDPSELHCLYAQRKDQVQRLLADLKSRNAVPPPQENNGTISPEVLERLRSLGYLK